MLEDERVRGSNVPPGRVLRVSRYPKNANAVSINGTLYDRPEVTPDKLLVGGKIAGGRRCAQP